MRWHRLPADELPAKRADCSTTIFPPASHPKPAHEQDARATSKPFCFPEATNEGQRIRRRQRGNAVPSVPRLASRQKPTPDDRHAGVRCYYSDIRKKCRNGCRKGELCCGSGREVRSAVVRPSRRGGASYDATTNLRDSRAYTTWGTGRDGWSRTKRQDFQ